MTIAWWALIVAGVLLITAEIFIASFVLVWFGLGAVLAGMLSWLITDMNIGIQVLLAAISGAVFMYFFRDKCVAKNNATKDELYTFTGGPGVLKVVAGQPISVFARGTYWNILNIDVIPEADRIDGKSVMVTRMVDNHAELDRLH